MEKEILQSLIAAGSALLGSGLTFLGQSKLANIQSKINKQKIKFEKNRESLAELKAYQLSLIHVLTFLKEQTELFEKNELEQEMYSTLKNIAVQQLNKIIYEATTLNNKQLDFQIEELSELYQDVDVFMCHYLLKDSYTDINKVYPKIDTYDTLISKSKKILDRIKETAKEIDE